MTHGPSPHLLFCKESHSRVRCFHSDIWAKSASRAGSQICPFPHAALFFFTCKIYVKLKPCSLGSNGCQGNDTFMWNIPFALNTHYSGRAYQTITYSHFFFLHMRKLRQRTELRKEFEFPDSWTTVLSQPLTLCIVAAYCRVANHPQNEWLKTMMI